MNFTTACATVRRIVSVMVLSWSSGRLKWDVRYEVRGGSGVEGGAFLDGEVDPAALVERSDPGLARQGRLVAVPRIGPIHEPLRGDGVHPRQIGRAHV